MKQPSMSCPNCSGTMKKDQVSGIPVKLCNDCGSFFMDQNAFQNLVGTMVGEHLHKKTTGEEVLCPGCNQQMPVTDVMGAEVDICPNCGNIHAERDALVHIADKKNAEGAAGSKQDPNTVIGFLFQLDVTRNRSIAMNGEIIQNFIADDVFIFFRDGLLVFAYTSDIGEEMDVDILTAMMSAITDFVQVSFKSFSKGTELESIRFKGKEIAFERGKYLVLALKLKGALDEAIREKLVITLSDVEKRYETKLQAWSGEVKELQDLVSDFRALFVPIVQ